jgi:hypothetical protein
MQNTECTQSRNQPQLDNQSKVGQQCHEGSAKVGGKALNVNENDVRDQPQQDNQSKVREQCHEDSAEVWGQALNVNENDVRNQAKGGRTYPQPQPGG